MGVGELARYLEMDQRRTQRLVSTLFDLGYLDQDPQTRHYRPGTAILGLGYSALLSMDLRQLTQPHLRQLVLEFKESANLAVREGMRMRFLDCLRGERSGLGVRVQIGDHFPIHSSSLGKAILANLPDAERDEIIAGISFDKATPYSIASASELRAQLAEARDRGYTVTDQERSIGIRSVGAALIGNDGYPVGAINVAIPTPLMSMEEAQRRVAPRLMQVATHVSSLLTTGGHAADGLTFPSPAAAESIVPELDGQALSIPARLEENHVDR
jgi:DNA-binding IclR family transcriptional regulator